MGAVAESDVTVRAACDVESIRVGEPGRIAIGAPDGDRDRGALGQGRPADLHGRGEAAVVELDGALVAQHLLDCTRQELSTAGGTIYQDHFYR